MITHVSDVDSGDQWRLRDWDGVDIYGRHAERCEAARREYRRCKAWAKSVLMGNTVVITGEYGTSYGRRVIDFEVNGEDYVQMALEQGCLRPWPHDDNNNPLLPKPKVCTGGSDEL